MIDSSPCERERERCLHGPDAPSCQSDGLVLCRIVYHMSVQFEGRVLQCLARNVCRAEARAIFNYLFFNALKAPCHPTAILESC